MHSVDSVWAPPHPARHYVLLSKNLCVISSASRTHEPYVPTCQVISRMLMRRHNMTSLRSLYVPQGLLPTTYYLLSVFFCQTQNSVSFCAVCKFFALLCLRLQGMKKSKKVRFLTRLGGIWISQKYVVYLYREKEILPQRGYLLHFCPIFLVKKGKITRHMRKNMCRTI